MPNHRTRHPVPCSLDELSLQGLSLVSGRTGHILSPPVSRDGSGAGGTLLTRRWPFGGANHLNSALLAASWPSTTATTSPYPLICRAEGSLLPPGCNSTARGTNLSHWWDYRMDVRPRHCRPVTWYLRTRELIPTVPSLTSGSWVRYYLRPLRENVTVLKRLTLPASFPALYIGTHVSGMFVPTVPLAAGTCVCQPP